MERISPAARHEKAEGKRACADSTTGGSANKAPRFEEIHSDARERQKKTHTHAVGATMVKPTMQHIVRSYGGPEALILDYWLLDCVSNCYVQVSDLLSRKQPAGGGKRRGLVLVLIKEVDGMAVGIMKGVAVSAELASKEGWDYRPVFVTEQSENCRELSGTMTNDSNGINYPYLGYYQLNPTEQTNHSGRPDKLNVIQEFGRSKAAVWYIVIRENHEIIYRGPEPVEVVKRIIPGCETLTPGIGPISETHWSAHWSALRQADDNTQTQTQIATIQEPTQAEQQAPQQRTSETRAEEPPFRETSINDGKRKLQTITAMPEFEKMSAEELGWKYRGLTLDDAPAASESASSPKEQWNGEFFRQLEETSKERSRREEHNLVSGDLSFHQSEESKQGVVQNEETHNGVAKKATVVENTGDGVTGEHEHQGTLLVEPEAYPLSSSSSEEKTDVAKKKIPSAAAGGGSVITMSSTEENVLNVIAALLASKGKDEVDKKQVTSAAVFSPKRLPSLSNVLTKLKKHKRLISVVGTKISLTDTGKQVAQLDRSSGHALMNHKTRLEKIKAGLNKYGEKGGYLIDLLEDGKPKTRAELAKVLGYHDPKQGAFTNFLSAMKTQDIIEYRKGDVGEALVQLAEWIFPYGRGVRELPDTRTE